MKQHWSDEMTNIHNRRSHLQGQFNSTSYNFYSKNFQWVFWSDCLKRVTGVYIYNFLFLELLRELADSLSEF